MPYDKKGAWSLQVGAPGYDEAALALIGRLEDDLRAHMAEAKPGRYKHSLSVAATAEQMALAYGVDPLQARLAGILHDWDKVLSPAEQIARAQELGVDLGVDPMLVQPLLHGMTAARHLPERYPELPDCIWQAIDRHTIGHADMTQLDMVVFVADGIEPLRRDVPAIHEVRALVDERAPLEDVYWTSFYHGVSYVIDTERYLYPGTLDIYNELALRRRAVKD
jgi:predicted HD superfamily hydrolase involved in NAD metabolism